MNDAELSNEIEIICDELIPILSRASVGDFTSKVRIEKVRSARASELLVGVQVLLDVINDKINELKVANAELEAARDRSIDILDDVLKKSLER